MKLLVLAQLPPPVHGQSLMVQTLVKGLPARGIALHHINLSLSRNAADIGRWRFGKIFSVLGACARTIIARFRHNCDTLYYIPAPGKRGALYRDWAVMLLCRPLFKRVVLHWHAAGLSGWLTSRATAPERGLTEFLLGRADLSLVLIYTLQIDAQYFSPAKIAVVPNGVANPSISPRIRQGGSPFQVLFLGLCCEEKGLFATAEAVLAANRASPPSHPAFTLRAAGEFPDAATASRFNQLCTRHPGELNYVGTAHGAEKDQLFQESDCLCLPSRYAAEGQPLVLLEAMAHDLPVIATGWRGIAATLPLETSLIPPDDPAALAHALLKLRQEPPPAGVFRQHYLLHFTLEQHLNRLAEALKSLDSPAPPAEI